MQWSALGSYDRMRILIVDGSPSALQSLAPFSARLGVTLECCTLPVTADADGHVESSSDERTWWHATARQRPDARALVFEGFEAPEQAARLLRAVRCEDHFRCTAALVAIALSDLHRLDFAGGFDDFLLSPYSMSELRARIHRVELRVHEGASSRRYVAPGLSIDYDGQEVEIGGQRIQLTAREFRLVAYLMQRPGTVIPREQIVTDVWGRRYHGSSRTVDTHIRRLRMKLRGAVSIETVRGSGYKLVNPHSRSEGYASVVGSAPPALLPHATPSSARV